MAGTVSTVEKSPCDLVLDLFRRRARRDPMLKILIDLLASVGVALSGFVEFGLGQHFVSCQDFERAVGAWEDGAVLLFAY